MDRLAASLTRLVNDADSSHQVAAVIREEIASAVRTALAADVTYEVTDAGHEALVNDVPSPPQETDADSGSVAE